MREAEKWMGATGGEDLPVKTVKSYLKHVNIKLPAFFPATKQKILRNWEMVWQCPFRDPQVEYCDENISEKAGLSTNYIIHITAWGLLQLRSYLMNVYPRMISEVCQDTVELILSRLIAYGHQLSSRDICRTYCTNSILWRCSTYC